MLLGALGYQGCIGAGRECRYSGASRGIGALGASRGVGALGLSGV